VGKTSLHQFQNPFDAKPKNPHLERSMKTLLNTLRHKTWVYPWLAALIFGFAVLGSQVAASTPFVPGVKSPAPIEAAESVSVDPALFVTKVFEWNDAARDRSVPAKLYLPAGPALSPGSVPLVVFSHGIGGSMDGYSYLGHYFAANGYASMHVQHVGSDRQIWRGNPLTLVSRLSEAAKDTEALNRVKDVKFALDRLLDDPAGKLIDTRRLVAGGHSYGANTTLLLAGARVDVNGSPMSLKDERFVAAILISAPPFYGLGDPVKIVSDIDVPTLHITATADDIKIPGYISGVEDRLALYQATGTTTRATKVLAVFNDGSHSIFTDRMGTGGAALNSKVKVATRQLALAFLTALHAKDDTALERWSVQNTLLLAQFEKVALILDSVVTR
jgi:dienelactone hydrolase